MTCCWPECDRPTKPERSYCDEHHKRVYIGKPPRVRGIISNSPYDKGSEIRQSPREAREVLRVLGIKQDKVIDD